MNLLNSCNNATLSTTATQGVGVWWHNFSSQFWAADLWLPEGVKWSDLHSTKDFKYPESKDVFVYPLMFSVAIIVLKHFVLDPIIFSPLAKAAGITNKRSKPPAPNKTLERIYGSYGTKPPQKYILEVTQGLEMSEWQIERWLYHRHVSILSTKYDKFVDCGYHLVAHTFMCLHGLAIMLDKPWLWNIDLCWNDYPQHSTSSDLWWYYMISLSYFWASTFIHMFSTGGKKSDASQMMLHHFFTILLMVFSWCINFVRVGTLVLMVHECVDIPLLTAKMYKYAGIEAPTDILFTIFLLVWICTRCYLYPFWILRSVFFEAPILTGIPVVIFCKGLLIGLLILNILWTILIAGIIIRKFTGGSIEDIRSDVDENSDEDNEDVKRKDD